MSVLLASAAGSACTSAGNNVSSNLSASSTAAYPPLPQVILTVPNTDGAEAGGSFAEASAVPIPEMRSADAGLSSPLSDGEDVAAEQPVSAQAAMPAHSARHGMAEAPASPTPAAFAGATPAVKLVSATPGDTMTDGVMPITAPETRFTSGDVAARSPELDLLMAKYAKHYGIPEDLVRRVAKRESTFNPKARNGPYLGLMQISHRTAQGMGYRGAPGGLLDAETNLKYAVRYLRGAWLVAKGNLGLADRLYQRGYYYDAKRAGLLDETGLGKDRRRRRASSL